MRLLALEAVSRMVDYLIERIDLPTEEWCKGRPGAVLSNLTVDLETVPPGDKTVVLQPVWSFWGNALERYSRSPEQCRPSAPFGGEGPKS